MVLDDMRWSMTKARAVSASITDDESWLSYLFPIMRYHDRWSELSGEDFKYFFNKPDVSINGFIIRSDILPEQEMPPFSPLADYTFSENSYKYLDMMNELCERNGAPLILMKAPLKYPHWYDEWDRQMEDYAAKHGLRYINFLELTDELGLDMSVDTFNGGLNLNVYGAEKMAIYFGELLRSEFRLADRRGEPETAARWDEKSELYERVKEKQLAEIEEYGKIQTFLID
jgi:hypothetical protein